MQPIAAVKGTHDVLPPESSAWEWLHRVHDRAAAGFGYQPVELPVLEHTELFERGVGAGTDIVDKQMFSFTDRGGRSLALRPEGTAGALRACLGAALTQQVRPLRVHYRGPMFRAESPQRGRYRQFHQVGVECIGELSADLDAEVIELGWTFLAGLGITDASVQLNSLGDHDDRGRYRQALLEYYGPLRDRLCDDCRRRLEINPLRLLDCRRDAGLAADAPTIGASLSPASAAFFARVRERLDEAGVSHVLNPRLVRGLDYYAHTAFEYWHSSLQGAQNALGGGGRYDGLAVQLGLPATPAIGYAFGVERLLLLATERGAAPAGAPAADAVVCSVEDGQAGAAAALGRELRSAGLRAVVDTLPRRLDRKLRAADRLGAPACLIVGPDEVRDGTVQVRDLSGRAQAAHPREGAVAAVRGLLGAAGGAGPG